MRIRVISPTKVGLPALLHSTALHPKGGTMKVLHPTRATDREIISIARSLPKIQIDAFYRQSGFDFSGLKGLKSGMRSSR